MRNVSKEKHSDLYYGVGGTYGTMGIITRVKMKLIDCESYVKINYYHVEITVSSIKGYVDFLSLF